MGVRAKGDDGGRLYQGGEIDGRDWQVNYLSLYTDCISPGVVKFRLRLDTLMSKKLLSVSIIIPERQPEMYDPRDRSGTESLRCCRSRSTLVFCFFRNRFSYVGIT